MWPVRSASWSAELQRTCPCSRHMCTLADNAAG
jgi:hypothetical protein